ncbi:uncharacterized protein BJ171DRAFT_495563 [Polychytrium aggregatum]|uniref:uncharacterized protein n=1 Tax=Polychytrium aggregatum TaxID=110093 RepID=UPI0022FEA410|nr:uncharacterized protein BJ171DRAFT_495563 [Polychytrium aggregatum]KAI9207064.1 hypothetical protein BJ171DRAFT_495563 [Polychytrium aggregatum]
MLPPARLLPRLRLCSSQARPRASFSTASGALLGPSSPGRLAFLELNASHPEPPGELELFVEPSFLSPEEQERLAKLCNRKLKRLCRDGYQDGHYDGVIKGYKECTISGWNPDLSSSTSDNQDDIWCREIIGRAERRIEQVVGEQRKRWMDPHLLELRDGNSGIGAHVDHLTASGRIVAGICLLTPAVMIFRRRDTPSKHFKTLLMPGCLYFQRDSVRYNYTHEIPIDGAEHTFHGKEIERHRRIVVLMRDALSTRQPGQR